MKYQILCRDGKKVGLFTTEKSDLITAIVNGLNSMYCGFSVWTIVEEDERKYPIIVTGQVIYYYDEDYRISTVGYFEDPHVILEIKALYLPDFAEDSVEFCRTYPCMALLHAKCEADIPELANENYCDVDPMFEALMDYNADITEQIKDEMTDEELVKHGLRR